MPKRKTEVGVKASKRAKVELDPVETAVQALLGFFQQAESVPPSLLEPISAMLSPLLSTLTEDRHELETYFAVQIGQVLDVCVAQVDQNVLMTAEELSTVQEVQVTAAEHVEATVEALAQAEAGVAGAQATFEAATETATAADTAVEDQQNEVSQLAKNKEKLEREGAELMGGLDLLQPDAQPTAKDTKKLVALLKQVGSKAALLDAIPSAIGCTEGFGLIVVTEGQKMLLTKHQEVTAKLGEWDAHCLTMQAKSDELASAQQVATEDLKAAGEALAEAQNSQQVAKAEKKDADSKLVAAKKQVTSKTKNSEAAGQDKEKATEAQNTYQTLFTRTEIIVEAAVEEELFMEVPVIVVVPPVEELPMQVMAPMEVTGSWITPAAVIQEIAAMVPQMEAPTEMVVQEVTAPVEAPPAEVIQEIVAMMEAPTEMVVQAAAEVIAAEPAVEATAPVIAPALETQSVLPSPRRHSATTMPTASPLRRASVEPVDEEMPLATEGF